MNPERSIDTTPPVITLIGDATVTLEEGKSFADLDSKALDNNDGVVSVVVSGAVDVNNAGTYVLTYTATDKAGNISTVTRTVIITKKDDNGSKSNEKSGGGSIGFILLPLLAIVGIRRKALILKK